MDTVRFVKSFSKGQITVPKEVRDALGMISEFWLKIYIQDGKIIAEPVEQDKKIQNSSKKKAEYAQKLLNIKGDWFDPLKIKRNRAQIEKQIRKRIDEKSSA